ncbi:hypothetical protein OHU25_13360 [Streptomyces sp. NBC_00117]|uniref:hypothetical protein n=1 Tax=Streptomyces sp. NBC_00117 TaxID=2975657 RepID=UPI00324EB99B
MSARDLAEPHPSTGTRTRTQQAAASCATTHNTLSAVVEHDGGQTGWAGALAAARSRKRLIGGP